MQIATFIVAVLGLALSALSIGWQAATYFLTGRRVKVELLRGATDRLGNSMVTVPVDNDPGFEQLADQG